MDSGASTFAILGSAAFGLSLAALGLFCRQWFGRAMAAVESDLAEKLRRFRASPRNLRKYLVAWLFAMALAFFGFAIALQNIVFAIIITGLILCAPWYLIRRMWQHHRQKIEDQLADAMVTMANAVKAGLSLAQSMEILAAQCPKPINAEFHQIAAEYKMGKTLERTLIEAKERLRSENFALFAAALLASHESGGRLNETVQRIAESVLELQRLERKVYAETAQARKSAVYMALAPVFILTVYYFIDPQNTKLLFTELPGQIILGVALVLNVIAYLWARVILRPDL